MVTILSFKSFVFFLSYLVSIKGTPLSDSSFILSARVTHEIIVLIQIPLTMNRFFIFLACAVLGSYGAVIENSEHDPVLAEVMKGLEKLEETANYTVVSELYFCQSITN